MEGWTGAGRWDGSFSWTTAARTCGAGPREEGTPSLA
jgi:hypothetical protein